MNRLTEQEIIERLNRVEIAPLDLNCQPVEADLFGGTKYRPDLFVNIKWGEQIFRFIAEIKSVATPKIVQNAIYQLSLYLDFFRARNFDDQYYPMIVAPYLSDGQIEELTDRNISGIDLSGNMVLIIPEKLFVLKTGNPNLFPASGTIKNVFRGTSSLVVMTVLAKGEFESVNEVLDEVSSRGGDTTLGTVSKVLQSLEEEFILTRTPDIRLIDARRLLQKLRENYRKPLAARSLIGKVVDLDAALLKIDDNCDNEGLRYAVNEIQRYAVFPTVGEPLKIYTENIETAIAGIEFRPTDRFADIQLIEADERSPIYFDRVKDGKLSYTSPLQVYLNLTQGSKREQEVAEGLEKNILRSAGGSL
ncbi:MAG: hypothetical protein DYH05_03925 [Acidobacteria bacterium ACB1]|nr:hypothetical protein [Pyrinomonadaceae bacterium]MCE7961627.1 hypothetical protein [Acidobacteria bacterium ACB1]RIJ96754.1 MAG: hypothetical protein DCC44_00035 [Acidobacteriota bacterium]